MMSGPNLSAENRSSGRKAARRCPKETSLPMQDVQIGRKFWSNIEADESQAEDKSTGPAQIPVTQGKNQANHR